MTAAIQAWSTRLSVARAARLWQGVERREVGGVAKGGLGLAYVDEPWVADDLARGQLRVVLPQLAAHASGLYLYYPQVSRRSPRVRALVEAARAG